MQISVFLASSAELAEDRKEVGRFLVKLNTVFTPHDIHLRVLSWESWSATAPGGHRLEDYSRLIRASHQCIFLFHTLAEPVTLQEYETAFQGRRLRGHPEIAVFRHDLSQGQITSPELRQFTHDIWPLEINWYANSAALKLVLLAPILRLTRTDIPLSMSRNYLFLAATPIIDLTEIPLAQLDEGLLYLSRRLARTW